MTKLMLKPPTPGHTSTVDVVVTPPQIVLSDVRISSWEVIQRWSLTLVEAMDLRDSLQEGIDSYLDTYGDALGSAL